MNLKPNQPSYLKKSLRFWNMTEERNVCIMPYKSIATQGVLVVGHLCYCGKVLSNALTVVT